MSFTLKLLTGFFPGIFTGLFPGKLNPMRNLKGNQMKLTILLASAFLCLSACTEHEPPTDSAAPAAPAVETVSIDDLIAEYLLLELSMGQHDSGHVDAYFGPEGYEQQAKSEGLSLEQIAQRATELTQTLESLPDSGDDDMLKLRTRGLELRLRALQTRIALNQGSTIDFDEESMRLFEATAPHHDAAHFEEILGQIDALLPGDESLPERVESFRKQFIIPDDRLSIVFEAALEECRRRTLQHIDLPAHESFSIEYVNDKPWSGYNWYQGNANSLIQVNTDLPKYIEDAVGLGCHEGYPGHHTYNALLEQKLVLDKGWLEFSLYPLFSPQSLIAEGSANYGVDLAFPGDERVEYEREHLFPLAGLNADHAALYYQLLELRGKLNYAGNEAARNYLNGDFDAEQAQQWLIDYALSTPEKAEKSISFYDGYRSYVINYNYGKDLVAAYVEADGADAEERWQLFIRLLSSPLSPSDLTTAAEGR